MKLRELTGSLDRYLDLKAFPDDVSNNGLQVEAGEEVTRVVAGVDACMALFEAARERGAELVIAHHGISWGAEPRRMTGVPGARLAALFRHGISLYAAHLPLDAHPVVGNNAQLAEMMDLRERQSCARYHGAEIGFAGALPEALTAAELAAKLDARFTWTKTATKVWNGGRRVRRAAVISGGGGDLCFEAAAEMDCEAVVTGEFTHQMYHEMKESGVAVIALGHYVSETVGVRAVLALLKEQYGIDGAFVDLPTGL